jgi:trehalose 6-phosphate phosphatase
MPHLFSAEGQAALERLLRRRVLLAFDFDGTLAPLVDRPGLARMRPYTAALLRAIARRCPVAVISGRSQADVAARLAGAPVVAVVGNHGAEVPGARPAEALSTWRVALEAALKEVPGVWVEDKQYSLSIHYRWARDRKAAEVAILQAAARLSGARAQPGKLVVNVCLAGAPDKGAALRMLIRRHRCAAALFTGDDSTDEDAFGPGVLGVRIGRRGPSRAAYTLTHQREVDRLLVALLDRLLDRPGQPQRPWKAAGQAS